MTKFVFVVMLLATSLAPGLRAQVEDPRSRLVQAYMAKRAEWVALREREHKRAKDAKDDKEKKNILKKLDEDEQLLRSVAADLARQVREAEKAKLSEGKPRG